MLIFHTAGEWSSEQVRVAWTDSSRPRIPEVEQLIEQAWDQATREPGIQLFDGPMCRLESWRASKDQLHLTLSRTSYKPFFGTNMRNPHLAERYGTSVLANPVGLSPALVSRDKYLLLGRRNASVAYYPNRLHPFAGALEPGDGLDVFEDLRRELREEVSFEAHDISDLRCTGLVEDAALRQPELIFVCTSTRTRRQIEAGIDENEHAGSWAIPATQQDLNEALSRPDEFTPVALAALLLWGRRAFGSEWFMTMSPQFRYDPHRRL